MTERLSEFGTSFQTKIIAALFTDRLFLQQVADILLPEHFESEGHQWIVTHIMEHFRQYRILPTKDVFKVKVTDINRDVLKLDVITKLKDALDLIGSSDLQFVKEETLKFCKNQEIKRAILESVDLLKNQNYEQIKARIDSAMKAGADTDIGLVYKEDIALRYSEEARNPIPTGWPVIDDLMNGGLAAGELGVVMAPAGIGKSWMLVNIGAHALERGLNVLHYTFELNQNYVSQRYDAYFTKIPVQNLKLHQDVIEEKVAKLKGNLTVRYFPTKALSTVGLRGHIDKFISTTNSRPDLIILDYADLMKVSTKREKKYEALEDLYEDLRGLAGEYEIPLWTATQANRSALEADIVDANNIAASYGKVAVADFLVSLSRKNTDKISGTGRCHVVKNRFGPDGITLPTKINTGTGVFNIFEDTSLQGKQVQQDMKNGQAAVNKSFLSDFEEFKKSGPGAASDSLG